VRACGFLRLAPPPLPRLRRRKNNPQHGSTLDDFLKEEGMLEKFWGHLADAIDRVARGDLGAFALVVDAKDADARRFYEHHGFVAIKDEPMRLMLAIATALKAGLGKPVGK
jgi:hypothetical protein